MDIMTTQTFYVRTTHALFNAFFIPRMCKKYWTLVLVDELNSISTYCCKYMQIEEPDIKFELSQFILNRQNITYINNIIYMQILYIKYITLYLENKYLYMHNTSRKPLFIISFFMLELLKSLLKAFRLFQIEICWVGFLTVAKFAIVYKSFNLI